MIRLVGVHKTFLPGTPDARALLQDFNLQIDPGEFVVLLGANGAGKSTLFHLLAGTETVDKGQIWIDGMNVTSQTEPQRAQWISRVFQDPRHGSAAALTLEENLALAQRRGLPRRLRGFRQVGGGGASSFAPALEKLGMGLESRLHDPMSLLSGGQRQAVTLLMASMLRPKILLLDEHTAALDPHAETAILALTARTIADQGLTALMITHNLAHALRYGTRLLLLQGGKIALDVRGKEKEALKLEELYARYGAEERI